MKHRTLKAVFVVLAGLGLLPWGGFGRGMTSSCLALTSLPQLNILADVTVDRKRVTLLDLCDPSFLPQDWKTLFAEDDIGAAPAPGSEKYIQPDQLKGHIQHFVASRGYDASTLEVSLPDRIVVKRRAVQVSREQVEAIYRDFILAKAPWGPEDVVVRDIYLQGPIELPAGEMTTEVVAGPRERFVGNVSVTVNFYVNGEKELSLRVAGKVDIFKSVVRAVHPLKRGDVIGEADIELGRVNIADAPDRFATEANQVVGKRLLRGMGVHQPIILTELDAPLALKRGSTVTIVFDQPGLRLTAKGEVRQDASAGSTVRVVNVMTNRTISCRVVDGETVQAIP